MYLFHILSSASEIMFTPFSLTGKNHVPHEIVERLQLAGYLCLVADFKKSPKDNISSYNEDGEERGTKRKKAPAVPSWGGCEVNGKFRLSTQELRRYLPMKIPLPSR